MRSTVPTATRRSPTVASTPFPVFDMKSDVCSSLMSRASAPLTIAPANGCSLPRSTEAASRNRSASDQGAKALTTRSFGLPSVSVPVLSKTRYRPFQSSPGLRPAEQNACGRPTSRSHHDRHRRSQAQRAGTGDDQHRYRIQQAHAPGAAPAPHSAQARTVTIAHPDHSGNKIAGHHIGRSLNRCAAALRLRDHAERYAPAACPRRRDRPASQKYPSR